MEVDIPKKPLPNPELVQYYVNDIFEYLKTKEVILSISSIIIPRLTTYQILNTFLDSPISLLQ
jgi:hypothetical protein